MALSSDLFAPIVSDDRPLGIRPRSSLAEAPSTAVVLGEAPDGLPLVLQITRQRSVAGAVRTALGEPDSLDPAVLQAMDQLDAAVAAWTCRKGLVSVEATSLYRSRASIGGLFGNTMLARILGTRSPLVLDSDRESGLWAEHLASTAAPSVALSPVTVMKGVSTERYLAVPTEGEAVFLIERHSNSGEVDPESLQPLRLEDLRHLPSLRFACDETCPVREGRVSDADVYRRAVRQAKHVSWSIGLGDVGLALVQLARSVQVFHEEGRVHCDLKPANAIIVRDSATAIDPIGVAVGAVSPGATPGWAAPELLLARPVAPATDVFALGLLLARLFEAAICGEERSFVIPTSGGASRRIHFVVEPEVYLDPNAPRSAGMSEDLRHLWAGLIRRSVAFDLEDRPEDAAAFADEMETLLAEEGLTAELWLQGGPGTLHRHVDGLGVLQPAWVVADSY